jgi:hypothetical protein
VDGSAAHENFFLRVLHMRITYSVSLHLTKAFHAHKPRKYEFRKNQYELTIHHTVVSFISNTKTLG